MINDNSTNTKREPSFPLRADLHFHTRFSDGKFPPEQLVNSAAENGLGLISITDHDTVKGLPQVIEAARGVACHVIPGVELEAFVREEDDTYYPVHLLGYGIDYENEALLDFLEEIKTARVKRAKTILKKLENFGINLDFKAVADFSGGESIGRVHVAQALKQAEFVDNVEEAFQLYIGDDQPAYQPKPHYHPRRVIELLHDSGGEVVWAHPYYTNNDAVLEKLVEYGLDGMECYHHEFDEEITNHYLDLAQEYNLKVTGGSDFHGTLEEEFKPGDWWYEVEEFPVPPAN